MLKNEENNSFKKINLGPYLDAHKIKNKFVFLMNFVVVRGSLNFVDFFGSFEKFIENQENVLLEINFY